jgi:flagellar assembly protein FliH
MSEPTFTTISVLDAQPIPSAFRPLSHPVSRQHYETEAKPNESSLDSEIEVDLFALGLAEGQSLAQASFEIERARFRRLIESAQAMQAEPSEELAVLIAETVDRLVFDIVGQTTLGDGQLAERARNAASLIAECDCARTLWVHPDDLPALAACDLGLQLMADAEAEQGSMRIDCSNGWIEQGTSLYLRELRAQLGLKEDGP